MKRYSLSLFVLFFAFCLPATALKVGVTAGPHADIVKKIAEIAAPQNLPLQIIEFNDFIQPNEALSTQDIDINSYQHEPFLEAQVKSRRYSFKVVAKTIVLPLKIYSKKMTTLKDLAVGAKLAIPNDPTNEGRALKLLEKAGLIKLNDTPIPSTLDIQENPKNLSFISIEAPLLPQSLSDVDAAIINTDWVLLANIDSKLAIFQEDATSPYVNILVVRVGDETREDIQKFIQLYHSPEIRTFIQDTYKGAVIPAWK